MTKEQIFGVYPLNERVLDALYQLSIREEYGGWNDAVVAAIFCLFGFEPAGTNMRPENPLRPKVGGF